MVKAHATLEQYIEVKNLLSKGTRICDIVNTTKLSRSLIANWKNRGAPTYERMLLGLAPREIYKRDNNSDPIEYLISMNPTIDTNTIFNTYSYILGLYLGDGHIGVLPRTKQLCITLDKKYPNLNEYTIKAFNLLFNKAPYIIDRSTHKGIHKPNCIVITTCSVNLGLLFPHEGKGRKHERVIELLDWQKSIINPVEIIKGLIMSDGSFFYDKSNKTYHYLFSNRSADIIGIFKYYLDLINIKHTTNIKNNKTHVNIYRKEDVARLHSLIGDKTDVRLCIEITL